jgi:hypothetical protein
MLAAKLITEARCGFERGLTDRDLTVTQGNTCKQQGTLDFEIRLR